jgi:large subunit ribosomal protein L5
MLSRFRDHYLKSVVPVLRKETGVDNVHAVPRIKKVVVNIGTKESAGNKAVLDRVVADVAAITGQKPRVNKARISVASFKLRQGDPIGVSATLRGRRMEDFLDKLFHIVLPRVRDFRGVAADSFDGHGNYSLGLTEQIVFPEIDYAKIDRLRGLEITIVTDAGNDSTARRLLELSGMPFRKEARAN